MWLHPWLPLSFPSRSPFLSIFPFISFSVSVCLSFSLSLSSSPPPLFPRHSPLEPHRHVGNHVLELRPKAEATCELTTPATLMAISQHQPPHKLTSKPSDYSNGSLDIMEQRQAVPTVLWTHSCSTELTSIINDGLMPLRFGVTYCIAIVTGMLYIQ